MVRSGILWLMALALFLISSRICIGREVFLKEDGNIYYKDDSGKVSQVTKEGKDHSAVLSPDQKTIYFVRLIKDLKDNPEGVTDLHDWGYFAGMFWSPDEIWRVNTDGTDSRPIIRNSYDLQRSREEDYLGWFGSLYVSKDGRKIYFLSQDSVTGAILYAADVDGKNIKKIERAHGLDQVAGRDDPYLGYLIAHVKRYPEETGVTKWTSVLIDLDDHEMMEIEDLKAFCLEHKCESDHSPNL